MQHVERFEGGEIRESLLGQDDVDRVFVEDGFHVLRILGAQIANDFPGVAQHIDQAFGFLGRFEQRHHAQQIFFAHPGSFDEEKSILKC